MTKRQIIALIEKIGLRPGRSIGQNFMVDSKMLDYIVRVAAPAPGDRILEVGPGFGSLTKRLLERVSALYAVELDVKLFSYLASEFKDSKLHLFHADAMKLDYRALLGGNEFRIISNLPYSISTPFILRIIESGNIPLSMHLVLQEETADRFAAAPGGPEYGASSVIAQRFFEIKKIRRIPPDVFYPRPEVGSALLAFGNKGFNPSDYDRKNLFRVVKAAFSSRRKTLANNLSALCGKDRALDILRTLSLPEKTRAEELGQNLYASIAKLTPAK